MADKKIEKALYGPSAVEVALGAFLGFLCGLLVACVYLMFKPVKTVSEPEKEPVAGVVYYQPGTSDAGRARQWIAKHKRFLAGGSVEVNEDELNSWASAELGGSKAPAAGAPDEGGTRFFTAQKPNFRIHDGVLQVGFMCRVDYFGATKDLQVIARGRIVRDGSGFAFQPDEFYLGSCPLHKLSLIGSPLIATLSRLHPVSEETKEAWRKLSDVQIDGRVLRLTVP